MYEYRIKEYRNIFQIQIKVERFVGSLWWREKIITWEDANRGGGVYSVLQVPGELAAFNSLGEAKKHIKYWGKGVTYYLIGKVLLKPGTIMYLYKDGRPRGVV